MENQMGKEGIGICAVGSVCSLMRIYGARIKLFQCIGIE